MVDNGIDIWTKGGRQRRLSICVEGNLDQQVIEVTDNAGGVKANELSLLIAPGETSNRQADRTIGFFGVGTKRAVVALAQDVRISTRYENESTFEVAFDDSWLATDEWSLPYYQIEDIPQGTTRVVLQRLRSVLSDDRISSLRDYLSSTYAKFINSGNIEITLNDQELEAREFDNWAYPPHFEPRHYITTIKMPEGKDVKVEVLAGLIQESSPTGGEYGVYVYCNERLVGRALKNLEVGYAKGLAGQPHPSISIARIILELNGPAELMPWNSNKSDIDPNHRTFLALRDWLVIVVKEFSSLARRWEGEWSTEVFPYTSGDAKEIEIEDIRVEKKSYLPALPVSKPRYIDRVAGTNREIVLRKPWTLGLSEAIVAIELISRQRKLKQKNRIMLILLDSTLEIALKEYLVNESSRHYSDRKLLELFQNRHHVVAEVKEQTDIDEDTWAKVAYYYGLRSKLVHERSTAGIDDDQVNDYWGIVEDILVELFELNFDA